jgi:hypothetical protein
VSSDNIGVIHIHAQREWHDDAYIVANRKALEQLRDMIDVVLREGQTNQSFMVQDGECFDLYITMDDSHWQSDSWKRRALPYTDEVASNSHQDNVIPPWVRT